MFKNRFILVVGVLSVLLFTMAVSKPSSNVSLTNRNTANDFYQRHTDWTAMSNNGRVASSGLTIDMMRYRTRNQNLSSAAKSTDLSDYYLRHPELRVSTNATIDTSDYFLRHPDLMVSTDAAIDTSDYFLRHPEWSSSAKSVDLSDYFLRHPELVK